MRRLRIYGLALLVVGAVGLAAAQSAFAALPKFSLPAGEEFPLYGEGSSQPDPHSVKIENLFGVQVFAEQVKTLFEVKEAGPSGQLEMAFTNVKKGKATCRSLGEVEGHVTLRGELRLVPTNKEGTQTGALITFPETTISCFEEGKEVLKAGFKPPTLWSVAATVVEEGEPVTSFSLIAKCSGTGKQELSTYFNDEEKIVEKQQITFDGASGCMELREELPLYLSEKALMPTSQVDRFLPYIQLLPSSEAYPVKLTGGGIVTGQFESPSANGFSGSEVDYTLEAARPGPSGRISLRLTGVMDKTSHSSCSTEGAGAGEVVVKGEYHLVFTSLSPLKVGILIPFPEMFVNCSIRFLVHSPLVIGMNATLESSISSADVFAKCKEAGKQELTSYYDDEGKLLEKQLMKWQVSSELPPEYACYSTSGEVGLWSTKEFAIYG